MTPSKDAFPEPCPPAPTVPQPTVLLPSSSLPLYNPHAAGIDIGEAEHWVAVPPDRAPQPVRRFGTFTADLDALADWLLDCGITTVAMESTGVYWIPLFELLEARGLQVFLIDPRQAKRAPGRPENRSARLPMAATPARLWPARRRLPPRRPGLRAAQLFPPPPDAPHLWRAPYSAYA